MTVNAHEKEQRKARIVRYIMPLVIVAITLAGACGIKPAETILFDFETDKELDSFYWKCPILFGLSDEHVTHGIKSLRLEMFPSEYPGLAPKLADTDWRGYRELIFDVFNPQKRDIHLAVRIDDRKDYPEYDDRFTGSFVLIPGSNVVRISLRSLVTPGGRPLDKKKISRIFVFMNNPKERTVVYFDYFRLV